MSYKIVFGVFLSLFLLNCKHNQEVRRPISHASGTFMKKSIDRNKKLNASEEERIKAIIKKDSKTQYYTSDKGYWYNYITKNLQDTITPKKGDVAFFNYEIKDIDGKIIYSELELRPQTYYVDKEDILIGLRDGIKLMHRGEKVNFFFPSHKAYGYRGDTKKIGTNEPLLITVTLKDFKSEVAYQKEQEERKIATQVALQNALNDSNNPTEKTEHKAPKTPIKRKDSIK
ncbi:gliding motility-associated peptidyl-prolyl isomerase GldI [Flavobacterium sp. NG2]|uniref:gliding motility-associated peptidyl-prolyl isomerase GldI n=1 Tax=Flavobacterium sp. NG2 TaxID=3097547 RepID=UPI002A7F49C7|nr:gliding motility-associated peptidyl-prolyl isomerase GldI [Flavobacterium sp. NG2]WPR70403.1 gliding motility-associated peptidyl-prolyl isomerase GldI [Flavobacterium sp. NG2]